MLKILFQSNQLSVRGTEVALYDYAFYNELLLGNKSLIAYNQNSVNNNSEVIEKFESSFPVFPYSSIEELDQFIKSADLDLMYSIKAGERDEVVSSIIPTMVHAVFPQKMDQVHGSSYAFVSPWLSKNFSNNKVPYVSHMINFPCSDEDLRRDLGIPKNAIVFGCYGGYESFDIPFVHEVIQEEVLLRENLFFIFMNIKQFMHHKNVIFMPPNATLDFKAKFINTCDAMIHARKIGESFGLACGEFSISNKPIITYSKSVQRSHIEILGERALLYHGKKSLARLLRSFNPTVTASQSWDCYSKHFSPEIIMSQFNERLIIPALRSGLTEIQFKYSLFDKMMVFYRYIFVKLIRLSRLWS